MDNIYNSVIEALVFASDEPLTPQEIINAVRGIDGPDTEVSEEEIEEAVAELNRKYEESGSAFTILRIAHGYSFATRPNHAKYVGFLSTEKSKRRLSNAALETLAIIAYKQPLTKPELEMIRGVNSDYTLNTLMEKNLVTISGRAETVGRPLLYATTDEFLKYFGLFSINDLPKPREIEEIMKDEDFLEQKKKIMMGDLEEEAEAEEALGIGKDKDDDDSSEENESDDSEHEADESENESEDEVTSENDSDLPNTENNLNDGGNFVNLDSMTQTDETIESEEDIEDDDEDSDELDGAESDNGDDESENESKDEVTSENDTDIPVTENNFNDDGNFVNLDSITQTDETIESGTDIENENKTE